MDTHAHILAVAVRPLRSNLLDAHYYFLYICFVFCSRIPNTRMLGRSSLFILCCTILGASAFLVPQGPKAFARQSKLNAVSAAKGRKGKL